MVVRRRFIHSDLNLLIMMIDEVVCVVVDDDAQRKIKRRTRNRAWV